MDLREKLINYIVENSELKREIDFGIWTEGKNLLKSTSINYYFNEMIVKNRKGTNEYLISSVGINMTEIHLNDMEEGFYLDSDLNFIFHKRFKETSRSNMIDNVIHNSYKDLKPFLDNFKLINKLESNFDNVNKSVKKLKI